MYKSKTCTKLQIKYLKRFRDELPSDRKKPKDMTPEERQKLSTPEERQKLSMLRNNIKQ
jgi:hypothetical protein